MARCFDAMAALLAPDAKSCAPEASEVRVVTLRRHFTFDPVLMMLAAMAVAIALTWIVPSGQHRRESEAENAPVIAGTYSQVPKPIGIESLLPQAARPGVAHPVSPLAMATSIPAGLVKTASLLVMILLLGGMFSILRASGALDAGIRRLLSVSGGRPAILVPVMMLVLSAGSTFLGMVTEYLLLIPVVLGLGRSMGRNDMFGFALVALSAKIGYLASVTNPFALLIAQPIAGVPVFSGLGFRLSIWLLFLAIAIVVVLRTGHGTRVPDPLCHEPLQRRHLGVLLVAAGTLVTLIVGSTSLGWKETEFSAVFVVSAAIMTAMMRITPARACHLFVEGMQTMVLAALLVGLGRSVELILRDGQILDTIIEIVVQKIHGLNPLIVAPILMACEMVLTLLIPSTSAKAALSIPILVPIAASCGVTAQTTVLAFLLGNGLINMFSPTSGMLLAYLATAGIPYSRWFRFVLPLFALLSVLSTVGLMIAVAIGY